MTLDELHSPEETGELSVCLPALSETRNNPQGWALSEPTSSELKIFFNNFAENGYDGKPLARKKFNARHIPILAD